MLFATERQTTDQKSNIDNNYTSMTQSKKNKCE